MDLLFMKHVGKGNTLMQLAPSELNDKAVKYIEGDEIWAM